MRGMVPRKSGMKYFEEASERISIRGFSTPVVFMKARCCFSIMRTCGWRRRAQRRHRKQGGFGEAHGAGRGGAACTGLMNGAEKIEAAVAAAKPGSPPSPVTYE